MDFDISPTQTRWLDRVVAFMDEHVYPAVPAYEAEMNVPGPERWKVVQVLEELKAKAKAAGLWNFFMPPHSGQTHVDDTFEFEGPQLTNLEYAPDRRTAGQGRASPRRCSTARRPTPATWKC